MSVFFGAGDGSFATVANIGGGLTTSVATGDFNGDGILDLVGVDYSSALVYLGRGDGTFLPGRRIATQTNLQAVVVADFNGDGVPDFAVAGANGRMVNVLLGNGDGTFQPARNFFAGGVPNALAVADLNRDGILDLVVANNTVTDVLLGDGDGNFQDARTVAAGANSVVAGDFNGDGIPDLAYTTYGGVGVLVGNGDGTFQDTRSVAANQYPTAVEIGDFNGDGIEDLAVSNLTSKDVSVLLGNGDGSFQPAQDFAAGIAPQALVRGDFNGDGIPDLAVANGTYSTGLVLSYCVSVLVGVGDGSFQPPSHFFTNMIQGFALVTGDFNGDGSLDVAVMGQDGGAVLLNDANWPPFNAHRAQYPQGRLRGLMKTEALLAATEVAHPFVVTALPLVPMLAAPTAKLSLAPSLPTTPSFLRAGEGSQEMFVDFLPVQTGDADFVRDQVFVGPGDWCRYGDLDQLANEI